MNVLLARSHIDSDGLAGQPSHWNPLACARYSHQMHHPYTLPHAISGMLAQARLPATRLMITLAAATSITACGGGEDVHIFKVKGQVLGISASGQRVCLDTNSNGRCEQGEPSALASESGEFSLQGPRADLLLEISTSAPKSPLPAAATPSIVLRAPWQEPGVISFHSTSIKAVMETQGVDFAAARQQVAATLGVQPRDLSREFNPSGDEEVRTELARAAEDGLARIKRALAGIGAGTEVIAAVNEAARVDRHYQTKTMYRPQGDWKAHEAPPAGYEPVYTQLVARHGSRGLSSMKSDLAVYNMWLQAQADGGLTPLGEQLGPDLLKYMKAHFLLGYGIPGITKPGYGNETQVGMREHRQLASRMLQRLATHWQAVEKQGSRKIVVASSGKGRAVDSAGFFVEGIKTARPGLVSALNAPVAEVDRFALYFHKLDASSDPTNAPGRPQVLSDSQGYRNYLKKDAELRAALAQLKQAPEIKAAARVVLGRLFKDEFIDRLERHVYRFTNSGTLSFSSDDGAFTSTLTGNQKASIESAVDAAHAIYDLYAIAPALRNEIAVDFIPYMPASQAAVFAGLNDAVNFYKKGPGIAEKGQVTFAMAQLLADDFFAEVEAIAEGDYRHAAKLRFAHAETVIPLVSLLQLKGMAEQQPLSTLYSYAGNSWRGEVVSPMASNMQWDVYQNSAGRLIVKLLFNEKEADFKTECDRAKLSGTRSFYDFQELKACYAKP